MNQNTANRLLKFYQFLQSRQMHGAVTWFEGEFHVNICLTNGKKISYRQSSNLDEALDLVIQDISSVGI